MKSNLFKPFNFHHIIPLFILLLAASYSSGQIRTLNAKKGDEFKRYIITKSNCVLQRGDHKLSLTNYSEIVKSYTVSATNDDQMVMTVMVNKLVDSTNVNGERIAFNSDKKVENGSNLQRVFTDLMGQPAVFSVGVDGKIISVNKQSSPDGASLAFVGISDEHYIPGGLLEIALNFPVNSSLKKGDSWTDSTATAVTKFSVYAINGRLTTITYTSSDKSGSLNSNVNGSMMVDNLSGIIVKRATQAVTVGYEVVNGVVYTAIRRTTTAEACVKDTQQ